jgi:drug/metabolite transporter (DMT)-like permease
MMGANHVSARFAFNNGVDVVTAVSFRSAVTALVVGLILWQQKVSIRITGQHKKYLPVIGVLIAVQSVCLYSSVARLPVALALLAFNTYPLSTAFWARILYKHQPEKAVLWSMPLILVGLALALDVLGAASGLGAAEHWAQIGSGVAFALAASATFGLALVLTQHETADVDGRLRTFSTMTLVGYFGHCRSPQSRWLSHAASACGLVGFGHVDLLVWHGVHHHVYGVAPLGCGGQLGHYECRAGVCVDLGLGLA